MHIPRPKSKLDGELRAYIGFHVKASMKRHLEAFARRRGISVAELLRSELEPVLQQATREGTAA